MMNLTKSERQLNILLRVWMILFTLASAVFYFFEKILFIMINNLTLEFFPALLPISIQSQKFWLVLAMSLMVTLVCLCYWAQKDIRKNSLLVLFILVSKFTSTIFFFVSFIVDSHLGAYFLGMLVDGSIFLITWFFYQRANMSHAGVVELRSSL